MHNVNSVMVRMVCEKYKNLFVYYEYGQDLTKKYVDMHIYLQTHLPARLMTLRTVNGGVYYLYGFEDDRQYVEVEEELRALQILMV